ncbi:MAG: FAD-dependent monooxygenase [Pyrinomonadaceae bacterium]
MTTLKTEVIIVGAGPTGLSLACQLQRFGIDFLIVEKNAGVTEFSKAIGVQARTLEIYEQLGLAQQAIAGGAIAEKVGSIVRLVPWALPTAINFVPFGDLLIPGHKN